MQQIYMSLTYEDWKELERQCMAFGQQETAHTTTAGFYHKAFRLKLGELLIEFQGPLVKAPDKRNMEMDEGNDYRMRGCRAGSDGDCNWKPCPQERDGEPRASGRRCPLDVAFPRSDEGRAGG